MKTDQGDANDGNDDSDDDGYCGGDIKMIILALKVILLDQLHSFNW